MNNLDHRDVSPSSQEAERAQFRATYAKMPDYELLHLRSHVSTLRDSAKIALMDEIKERDLKNIEDVNNSRAGLEGVRGWLFFVTFMVLVLLPLTSLANLVQEFLYSGWTSGLSAAGKIEYLGDGVLKISLAALGMWAGLKLWRIKPGAVRAAKGLLIGMGLYGILAIVFMFAVGLTGGKPDILFMNAFGAVGNIPGAILAYMYFNRSKRVAATYGPIIHKV